MITPAKFFFALLVSVLSALTLGAAEGDTRCFELRTYYAASNKLDALLARFRDHTCKLFEKHGMENIGYWVPIENPENQLIYLLAYPSRAAREKSWKEFGADPDWQKARRESEAHGALVRRADAVFLNATDYSPPIKPLASGGARTFELRTYTASSNNLPALHARFRDHTVALFSKHGMTHVGYWTPSDKNKGADNTLIYLLAHRSPEAAAESFKAFRADPDWIQVKEESEKKAGGPLTEGGMAGVKSVFLKATDFSPMR